ncbi:hypothetical protein D3C71_1206310 [compost metagenome]
MESKLCSSTMRSNCVKFSRPTCATLASNEAWAAASTFSRISSSVMALAPCTTCCKAIDTCHSSASTFSSAARSHCSSTDSAGTYWRTRSVMQSSRMAAITSDRSAASRMSLRCW